MHSLLEHLRGNHSQFINVWNGISKEIIALSIQSDSIMNLVFWDAPEHENIAEEWQRAWDKESRKEKEQSWE